MAVQRCVICDEPCVRGVGYVALGYRYHPQCFPFKEAPEKQRCFYCHKIIRRGDKIISLGDLGMGGSRDRICAKCADKHFAEESER